MRKLIVLSWIVAVLAMTSEAKTKAMFFFDTEDYTCDRSNDTIRDIANILVSEGVDVS